MYHVIKISRTDYVDFSNTNIQFLKSYRQIYDVSDVSVMP